MPLELRNTGSCYTSREVVARPECRTFQRIHDQGPLGW